LYWSNHEDNKYPCFENTDGYSIDTRKPVVEVEEFGSSVFNKTPHVYFGVFSESGIHLKLGVSYRFDTFGKVC